MMILPHFISDIINKDIETSLNIRQYIEMPDIVILAIEGDELDIGKLSASPAPFNVRYTAHHKNKTKIYLELHRKIKMTSGNTYQVHPQKQPHASNIPDRLIPHPLLGRSGKDLAAGIDKDEDSSY